MGDNTCVYRNDLLTVTKEQVGVTTDLGLDPTLLLTGRGRCQQHFGDQHKKLETSNSSRVCTQDAVKIVYDMSDPDKLPPIVRDEDFYLPPDEMAIFLVEDHLFRAHRYLLAKYSPIFRDMFSLPAAKSLNSDNSPEGFTDSRPIVLPEVTILEFRTLLHYLYNMHDDSTMPKESWVALLSVAHRYDIAVVQSRTAKALVALDPPVNPVELIAIASKYDLPRRPFTAALETVIRRSQPFSIDEIEMLPSDMLTALCRGREWYIRDCNRSFSMSEAGLAANAQRIVKDIFLKGVDLA
ncbi:hypothetical protein EWM64_g8598 [Hericium alpestre]|uniref:BTB domain-containing protein n=1 Tax=Hericium alpestre TaxID=135208 RepID=A0A4Y9ZN40_9AGAM|nr:hypothetical protein EWM64_g8598 [Hericium alpestre]